MSLILNVTDTLTFFFETNEYNGLHSLKVDSTLSTAKNPEKKRTRHEITLTKAQWNEVLHYLSENI